MEGFIDCSAILRCGVYVLSHRGRVVYVGRSKTPLTRIYTHRNLARKAPVPWLAAKGVVFDRIELLPCHPDEVAAVEARLIEELAPCKNILLAFPTPPRRALVDRRAESDRRDL